MLLVGLLLEGLTCSGGNSLAVLIVLATLFGIVGRVGPDVCLAMLTELCGASLLRDSLI
jgi:hypothetical protein